jgi:hypothetical protein
MEWITNHWTDIVAIVTGIVTVASIIAKLTPTETDNAIIAKVLQIVDMLALNNKPTELKPK